MNSTADRSVHDRSLILAASAIDGPLTSAEASELERHLASCPVCTRRAATMRSDASTLGRPLDLLPSRRVDDAVYAAINEPASRPGLSLVLVAAVALLLLALAGALAVGAYLLRLSEQESPISVQPSEPPVVLVSPPPDASPVAVGDVWNAMSFDDASSSGYIVSATFNGSDVVGVGRGGCDPDFSSPTSCYGAAWTAVSDGPFVRAPDQPGLEMGLDDMPSGPVRLLSAIAAGPAGLVAVGYDVNPPRSTCAVAPCTTGPAVWRSRDGQTWERVKLDLGPGVIDRFSDPIAAIAAGPDGYLMVGFASDQGVPGPEVHARAAAWASPDGVTWTRATDNDDLDVGPCFDTGETPACGGMRGVAWTGSGWVAVGQALNGNEGQSRPAAWTSPDGLNWTLAVDGLDFDGFLSGVAAGGPGLVAIGSICDPSCIELANGVAATSEEGSRWGFAPIEGATGLEDVGSAGGPVFALGTPCCDTVLRTHLELWRTDDGIAWQQMSNLPATEMSQFEGIDIAVAPGRVVVVAGGVASGSDDFFTNVAYSSSSSP